MARCECGRSVAIREGGQVVWFCTRTRRGQPSSTRFMRRLGRVAECPYCKTRLLAGGRTAAAQGTLSLQ